MPPPFELNKAWTVRQFSMTFKHVFNMTYLYERLRDWLVEEDYCQDGAGPRGDKWMEHLYLERVAGNGAKQIWIWWRTSKDHINPFFKFYLNIDFQCINLVSHEIVVEGTKVKTNKGECETFVTARMELDPKGEWDKNFILRNPLLRRFYLNRIYKQRIQDAEDELVRDAARLLGAVKQYFQLESWMPEYSGKPFYPVKGH